MPADPSRVQAVFLLAVEAADAHARVQVMERECGADAELRQRVESLLQAHDASGGFLDKPPAPPFSTVDHEPSRIEGPGSRIGPYKLLQQVGEGGMGVVFLAEQLEPVQRKVALKVIKPGMDTRQVVVRFEAERQALALMDHPNIAKVLDAGATESGRPYFVMELVKGLPITKYCDQEHLTPQERLQLFLPICQAVQHAHQKGIIHRDLKPSNILIALYDGRPVPKVIDFGVAKATDRKLTDKTLFTEVGHAIGTWEYMAPEQAELNNLDIDTRADIYALGATLYELLAGSPPFTRKQLRSAAFEEMLRMIREVEPPKPSTKLSSSEELPSLAAKRKLEPAKLSRLVRGDLDWIVMKCLEKDRGRRYETANGLAMDVQRYLADEPVLASPPSAVYRLRKFAKRHRGTLLTSALIGLVLLFAAGSLGWALWDRAEQRANHRAEKIFQAKQNGALAETSLARLDDLHKQYLWTEAEALLDSAEKLAGPEGDPDLLQRITRAKRKTKLLHGLDNAHLARAITADGHLNVPRAQAAYRAAFAEYGLVVQAGQIEGVAQRIRAEEPAVRGALVVALDDWSSFERTALRSELLALAGAADADPWSQGFRRAVAAKNGLALCRLAEEARRLSLPASHLILLAGALRDNDRLAEAVALLRWARGRHPTDYWLAVQSALFVRATSVAPPELEETLGCYRVAVALRPDSAGAYNGLGLALSDRGQLDDAIAAYHKAIELDPKLAPAYDNLGYALHTKGQSDDAIAAFKKAIELDPKLQLAYYKYGIVLKARGQLDDAIAAYKKAVELNPNYAMAYNNLGIALVDKGQPDDAIVAFKRAIELDSKNAMVYSNLGAVLNDHKGRHDEAITAFKKTIELDPNNINAHHNLGVALEAKGQLDDAIAAYKKAIELDPKLPNAYRKLGLAFLAKGQLDDAITTFKNAVQVESKFAWTNAMLGYTLFQKAQWEDALAAYKKAIDLDPNDIQLNHRFNAARCAAILAAGKGTAADKLDDKKRASLRQQALEWLRADLAHWTKQAASDKLANRTKAHQMLSDWQRVPHLAIVRDKDAVAKLPAEERAAWEKLWAEVATVLKNAERPK